jgi:hypothetical protein
MFQIGNTGTAISTHLQCRTNPRLAQTSAYLINPPATDFQALHYRARTLSTIQGVQHPIP